MNSVFFKLPYLSFFDFRTYREVALFFKGTNLLYLLVLVAICWIPMAVRMHLAFNDFVENDGPGIINQIPEIRFSDGKAFSQTENPVFVKSPSTGEIIGLIDTNNRGSADNQKHEPLFVLGRDTITVRNLEGASNTWSVSQLGADGVVLDRAMLEGWLRFSGSFFVMLVFPFAVFISFVFRMLQIFIYAAMLLPISAFTKAGLKFENTFRLATVAITPGLILKAALDATGLSFQFAEAIMSMITLGLAAASVRYIKEQNTDQDEGS